MFTIDFNTPIHVHFIGIGGISMSGLAKILLDRHFTVSGSDAHISDLTTELQQDGCIISYPQSADNITGDIDLVVYTAAIHPDNPELKAAVDAGIPTLTRAELLGQIMKNYHTAVNVAGTHGKTTTTLRSRSQGIPIPIWELRRRGRYCVRTPTVSIPELIQLLNGKSIILYLPPNATAGFATLAVRTPSLLPCPPANSIAIISFLIMLPPLMFILLS